jgi:CheY-like chemotaxis protein
MSIMDEQKQTAPAPQPAVAPPAPNPAMTAPAQPAAPAATPVAAAKPATSGSKKILLVEDDDALANVYMTRLQAEGFDVKRVPNGEDALATALQYKPDLILLDVMMPKVSGFDVLDILRNTPETNNVKVIMLTALSQDSDKERATQLGADDYLVKSQVVIADVVDRIRHHLGM